MSPCAGELNFIKIAETPIIYHAIDPQTSTIHYAATLSEYFDPTKLLVSKGKMYYPAKVGKYGLLRSHLAIEIGDLISEENGQYMLQWNNSKYPIQTPRNNELP